MSGYVGVDWSANQGRFSPSSALAEQMEAISSISSAVKLDRLPVGEAVPALVRMDDCTKPLLAAKHNSPSLSFINLEAEVWPPEWQNDRNEL